MQRLHEDQIENAGRLTELIHVALGYHHARMERGHPFALAEFRALEHSERNLIAPKDLHDALLGKRREAFDLASLKEADSPSLGIARAVTASVWDSYNQIYGLIDAQQQPELHPLILDEELGQHIEAMESAEKAIHDRAEHGQGELTFDGIHRVHAGFRVGITAMTMFAAAESGLPNGHPFNAVAASRIFAKADALRLSLMKDKLEIARSMFPDWIREFFDAGSPSGISPHALDSYTDRNAFGCPALGPMGPVARRILTRHGLYRPELDGKSATKILATDIRAYVHRAFDDLRIWLDFQDSAHLPEFDRRVVERTILGPPQVPKKE